MKFRKVNSNWSTIEVVSIERALDDNLTQVNVDVSKCPNLGTYIISVRNDSKLDTDAGYVTDFAKRKAARAYAQDYAIYLLGQTQPSCPRTSAQKYVDLDC